MGQQAGIQQPQASAGAMMLSYPESDIAPARIVRTRAESAGRELVTEAIEVPHPNGGYKPYVETTTETVRVSAESVRIKREVIGRDPDGRPQLIQSTQADQENLPDGTSRSTENTWTPDLDGRLQLSERQLQETKSAGPNVKQTTIATFLPDLNEPLHEARRFEEIERQVSKDLIQSDSTHLVRDGNGRWQPFQTSSHEVRSTGNESTEEEIVRRVDANGALSPVERRVIRRSASNGREDLVIETYAQSGGSSLSGPLTLNERLHKSTVTTADGGRETVEDLEARNVALNEPLRLVSRIVETVRAIGPDRWETLRQAFALDANGRFVLAVNANGEAIGK